jgi:sec-independent protein translocase protein TatA
VDQINGFSLTLPDKIVKVNSEKMLLFILLFLGTEDAILIAFVILLLFGGKKIPEVMRSLGKGVKSFKDGINGLEQEIKDPPKPDPEKESDKNKPSDKSVS